MPKKKSEAGSRSEQAIVSEKAARADAVMDDLKAALAKGGVLFGSRSVVKALKLKNPKVVFVASNCPESLKKDIDSLAKISGARVESFAGTGKQLGIFCGKPFSVASAAVLEEKKK
jgi:large subunit ribosomal protein L30e